MPLVESLKQRRRAAGSLVATCAAVVSCLTMASSASADVFMERSECGVNTGDVPGLPMLPRFDLTDEGLAVGTPGGIVTVRCHGVVPEGSALPRTFQGDVLCAFPWETTIGHLVITKSGQGTLTCWSSGLRGA